MRNKSLVLVLAVCVSFVAAQAAHASLVPFQIYVGNVGVSTNGWGNASASSGTISASVPVGATVVAAYLYSAYYDDNGGNAVAATLNGNAVAFGPKVPNATDCCSLGSARADVTSIVAPVINGGPGGVYDFTVGEGNTSTQDGEGLVVVYSLSSLPISTVGILDGFSAVGGDTATMTFANPLDPTQSGFFAEMFLGDGFSCCSQSSTVKVDGITITTNAGNRDDSTDSFDVNGGLITVGGFDDPISGFLPSYADDHEHYSLTPEITKGDTSIVVNTNNPTSDDNIFLAVFHVTGEAGITTNPIPEPTTLLFLGTGLAGLALGAWRRRK